tara:strand:+ start:579 stop:773 length:195 start_codon:yes stop_codon:yes gene_type:complete
MSKRQIKTQTDMHKGIADALITNDIELLVDICDQVHDWLMIEEDHFQISRMLSAIIEKVEKASE